LCATKRKCNRKTARYKQRGRKGLIASVTEDKRLTSRQSHPLRIVAKVPPSFPVSFTLPSVQP
jgi:hypothetical protein